jgi:hypothetical protein
MRDFVAALAIPRKSMNEIKILTGQANSNKNLKKTLISLIINKVKDEKPQLNSVIPIPKK